jgi:hypothetical protein
MTRTAWIVSGCLAALLAAVIVVGIVLVGEVRGQTERQAFSDCMARQGFPIDEPADVTDEDDVDPYINAMADAAEFCDR